MVRQKQWFYDICIVVSIKSIPPFIIIDKSIYNPKSEKVGTVWKTQIKKESSDF